MTRSEPEPLRVASGHGGSHTHLTHEFVSALADGRAPAIDLQASLAMTVPGIVAHESALKGGVQMDVPELAYHTPTVSLVRLQARRVLRRLIVQAIGRDLT